jgi:transposase
MWLADRGYDADWNRELARQHNEHRRNIPSKQNRRDPICFSPYLYRACTLIELFLNKIKQYWPVATRTTSSQPTIWRSSNSPQSESGYALMSHA